MILQMAILLLVATGIWWHSTKKNTLFGYCFVAILAGLLYIPGMIWFELLVVGLSYQKILEGVKTTSWLNRSTAGGLFVVLVVPLLWALLKQPHLISAFAGLPTHFASLGVIFHNLLDSVLAIAIHSNGKPELWLGHAPLLNIVEFMLLALGSVVLIKRHSRIRTYFMGGAIIISLVLTSLGGPVTISSTLPLLYLVIGIGLYELLQRWLNVFPRNPFARFTGVFFICLLILFSVLYQYRAYFLAWPHNIDKKQTFTVQQS
jgi:hypothetical protein